MNLFYPPETGMLPGETFTWLTPSAWKDLGFDQILPAFTGNRDHQKEIRELFMQLVQDAGIIRYRQEILADLQALPELADGLSALLPTLDSLARYSYVAEQDLGSLHEVAWRIGELQNITGCIDGLAGLLLKAKDRLASRGLRLLLSELVAFQEQPVYQNLVQVLPELLSKLRACASLTIGVNLDASLRPVQATLISVNDKPFTNQSLFSRLFGNTKDHEGIAPLHSVPQRSVSGQYALPISSDLGWAVEPMMVPLFADLAIVMEKATLPIAQKLKEYGELHSGLLISLRPALLFYLGALRLMQTFHDQGLPVCCPEIAPRQDRLCQASDSYNAMLALKLVGRFAGGDLSQAITKNDIRIGPDGRILILTGPNQGGKTTYLQGIGILQVLAQIGCYVPGRQARVSPVDNIYTHFPLEEKPEEDAGRFGEEAMRLGKIFEQVTGDSLVLLNESLSSTSFGESLYLAEDVIRILRRVGARAIYSTHLHELGHRMDDLNRSVSGSSKVISLVSSPIDEAPQGGTPGIKPNYRVEIRPPLGQSYAREIAARYGIRYEQLETILSNRGVLS